jgi:hypothetical protein
MLRGIHHHNEAVHSISYRLEIFPFIVQVGYLALDPFFPIASPEVLRVLQNISNISISRKYKVSGL